MFAGYRSPMATDNLAEDVEYDRENGGTGCLGVAVADFDGDHAKDYLLGLASLRGTSALSVVALSRGDTWYFQTIRSWVENNRSRLYVMAVKPGRHDRTASLSGPIDKGEKESMQCPNWGAQVGATESTGIVYCYIGGQWYYVWVSD